MKSLVAIILLFLFSFTVQAQYYFPPNDTDLWETTSPTDLGWCPEKIDSLYNFLDINDSKAFILLKDGKVVLESYFNGHSASTNWYWASAGKALTAFMVGVAQQENYLSLSDTTSTYLGEGWTDCAPNQEEKITIRHQLTMTSGLDDGVPDPYCTIDTCLQFLEDADTRWAYHNAPYTLLGGVIENAVGQSLNLYTAQKVKNPIGMNGLYIQQDYNTIFFSTARSMARFGLLILNEGNWDGNPIMTDTNYFNEMVNTSQDLNESYGYLWWLNGKDSYRAPQTQFLFPGSFSPSAPNDMIAALGKNGQFLNIVPSQDLVWIRMGNAPDSSPVSLSFNDAIWEYISNLECSSTSIADQEISALKFDVYTNPVHSVFTISTDMLWGSPVEYKLYNPLGEILLQGNFAGKSHTISVNDISRGLYFLVLKMENKQQTIKILKG